MKKTMLLISSLLSFCTGFSQNTTYTVISDNQNQTILDITVGELKQVQTVLGNQVKIMVDKGTQLLQKGNPDLPKLMIPIMIPNQKNSTISILESEFTDIANVSVVPGKGSMGRNTDRLSIPFIYNDTYLKNEFFPAQTALLNQPFILRDLRGQTVMIHPVQYNPVTKTMRVFSHFRLKISYSGESTVNIFPSSRLPDTVVEEFDGMYKNRFINYKTTNTRYSPLIEQGSLLILCPAAYLGEIAPFVKWKEMKGIKTWLVNTDTILGGVNSNTIKNLANYYYQSKQIAYMLIVGDDANIPPMMPNGLNPPDFSGPSDIAYAYINNGDHYPEFVVGRFSGESVHDIRTQVERTLQYEKTPNTSGTWMSSQMGVASSQGTGDDNQYDFEHIHDIVDSNKNQYTFLTNIEEYDDTAGTTIGSLLGTDLIGDPDIAQFKNGVNAGVSLINYCGHGNPDGINTTSFNTTAISLLNNYNKLPFMLVVGCSPGTFNGYTCFAESLQRSQTGSVAFGTISSFMATIEQYWDEPMQAQDEFNAIMRGARPSNLKSRIGAMCFDACMSMNDQYNVFSNPNGITGGSDMTDTWIYFGDPTVSIYTKNEGNLTMTYDVHIQQNKTSYEVHCPVNGATIGLYYQGKHLASSIVYGGIAYFNFPAVAALDTVFITATKQNYTPASGTALVVGWATGVQNVNDQNVLELYPNPASDILTANLKGNSTFEQVTVLDAIGNIVYTSELNANTLTLSTKQFAAGMYILKATTSNGVVTRTFTKR